jgi:hypothetical protein
MEPSQPHRYSDLEKQELIEQWKQSGKTKTLFCKEHDLSYFSFCIWSNGKKKSSSKSKNSFVPLKLKLPAEAIFCQLILKNGTTVNLYHPVDANYLACVLKA